MCGIAGWIDCRRLCDSAAIMRRMAQTMVPRGPDSGGLYTDDNCALAHRRLSVIDPARSAQPMTRKTALDSYTIVYNGELYNTAEIRSELESTGISFTSSGDTEVLLWAYITWGEACLDKLNGIYAFAVWQEKEKQLFLARDRIGVKPLFYYEYAGGLIFASEIKTLLAHPMIEPVIEIFGKFDGAVVGKLREDIFDAFLKTDYSGLIFTYMWAFDMQSDWDYIKSVTDKFEATGGNVYYVELVADRAVRIERNKTENRLKNKASKRDIVVSEDRMLREETKYRLVSNDGEIPFENYMKIDNTNLEPSEVALMIKERFNLQGISVTELMNRVKLEGVREDEIEQLYDMQIKSFMSLYEKYHDEGSPAIESIERVRDRASQENRKYYFIVKDGARVGAINIGKRLSDPEEPCLYISPLFILPKYQKQGIGYVAIQKAFALYPDTKVWKLDTILQESGNCHLYEKCGFVRVGEEHIINDKMTLVNYEKR